MEYIANIIYAMAALIGFFGNTIAALAFGYQFFTAGLDNAHKAIFAAIIFNVLFFGAILIIH